ncbi:S24 family peptidase [Massilia arenosa]|uniref:S24 family peptidase n=1 Tax=Zemynaea arenosa TaxID=2561931 RepID=A0A4Y9RWB5_9BURK|nr:S24 family peptidase [Massilia arenosa]TFW13374.1 S24 family peptidase [Massilia arenosa]
MRAPSNDRRRNAFLSLVPGFRERLISELRRNSVPQDAWAQHLAALTGCAVQTAVRWIAMDKPGLPDLSSVAALCVAFAVDANWLLGLSSQRATLAAAQPPMPHGCPALDRDPMTEWVGVCRVTMQQHAVGEVQYEVMRGDEMMPEIPPGAPILVDSGQQRLCVNGIYALRYEGALLVRRVEVRIGEGVMLRCANPAYPPTWLASTYGGDGFAVIGRVLLFLKAHSLSR